MLHVRTMTAADLPLGMRLKDEAGWNQTTADWQRMLALQPDGCFVAEFDGRAVGTTTTCVFDSIGWIAMVLVDKAMRGRGVGTGLMRHALAYLDRTGVPTVRLDATALGRPVYEPLGFVAEYELARWTGVATCEPGAALQACKQCDAEPPAAIYALDEQITGTNRRRLLERFFREQPANLLAISQENQLSGYAWIRPGARFTQIGPAAARDADTGIALIDAAFCSCHGQPILIDIPIDNRPAMRWAESRGLTTQRTFTRMSRGAPVRDQPLLLWASSGPEKG